MKLIQYPILILMLLFASMKLGFAQSAIGNVKPDYKESENKFSFFTDQATVQIEICTAEMVRIRTSWDGTFEADEPYMVIQYAWEPIRVDIKEEADFFLLTTSALKMKIHKAPLAIEIANSADDILSTELLGSDFGGAYENGEMVGSRKKLMADEHFFGFGERMDFTDQRGKDVHLNVGRGIQRPHIIGAYNILEANYSPVPFFMSTKGYGIFLHNSFATRWDMGHSDAKSYAFEAENGELDYYFIYGPDFPSILDRYTTLTGKSPLLPRFAHGLHVGTYSGGTWGHEKNTSTHYVVALAKRYRENEIPLDVLHLDSTWRIFGKSGGSGATTFEWRETFIDPKSMFDSLYDLNLNMVGLHVRPRLDNGPKFDLLDKAREAGHVYPEEKSPGEFVNFFDSAAVDWWWENAVMKIADLGAMFLKTDEGSAFGRQANESDKVGPTGEMAKKLHNVFPVAYAKAPYEKFKAHNKIRGMNHTREGYAGIQRYPFIWAGDWPSEWQYFAPVIRAGINMGLSGIGYWTHNMGGFEHDADPELYIRWVQFGMFSPVAHVFGMDHPGYKEPWNYGEEALKNFKQYDQLRYRMIPYIYAHAFEQYKTGMPLMRALVMDNQHDRNTYAIDDQYMFGSSLMICPVTVKDAQTRIIYLPEGTWFDYWTGKAYEGRRYYNIVTPLDILPIFVKKGGIIPMQDDVQYDNKQSWGTITFEIFPSENSNFDLYEDDGLSEDYKEGNYSITTINSQTTADGHTFVIEKSKGNFSVPARDYILKIHTDKAPAQVTRNGVKKKIKATEPAAFAQAKNPAWYYDEEAKVLWVKDMKASDKEVSFQVSY